MSLLLLTVIKSDKLVVCHSFNCYGTVSSLKGDNNPVIINNASILKACVVGNSSGKARLLIYVIRE